VRSGGTECVRYAAEHVRVPARPSATNTQCSLSSRKCMPFACVDWITMGPMSGPVSGHLNEKSLIVNRIQRMQLTMRQNLLTHFNAHNYHHSLLETHSTSSAVQRALT
jgi:hypothetical protein